MDKERYILRNKRSEVAVEQTWAVEDLFSNRNEWEEELHQLREAVKQVTQYKGKLGENAETLLEAIKAFEDFQIRLEAVGTYAFLNRSTDGSDPQHQGDAAKFATIQAEIGAELSFFESELLTITEDKIKQFLEENEALKVYEKMLNDILEKKTYTLHPDIEKTLAALNEVHEAPFMIYETSKAADMEFEAILDDNGNELPMSEALYEDRYEIEANTTIRRNAYDSFIHTLERYKNTYAATYATEVTKQVTLAKIRGFQSVTDMLLLPQQVTKEMYENQLDIIQKELAPHMRKLAKLKEKKYSLEKIRFCDLKAPFDPTYDPETTFVEAKEMILEALNVLGPEYRLIMEKAFHERWIDYADNIGKQSGAFCASPYRSHPYILVTWTNKLRGAFTLAHELGHAGHFYLANKHQTFLNTEPSTYFIEAPSTLNELLLAEYLLENASDERMKRWIISALLDTYYHNFITHLLEGEFQRRIYRLAEEGTPLTADVLCREKYETIKNFWGDAVEIDEGAGLTWMRQPHYYMGLYPYTYSAGLTVATAVLAKMKQDRESTVNNWLDVLKAGGTMKPLELIQRVGVNMTNPDTIRQAVNYVGELIHMLE